MANHRDLKLHEFRRTLGKTTTFVSGSNAFYNNTLTTRQKRVFGALDALRSKLGSAVEFDRHKVFFIYNAYLSGRVTNNVMEVEVSFDGAVATTSVEEQKFTVRDAHLITTAKESFYSKLIRYMGDTDLLLFKDMKLIRVAENINTMDIVFCAPIDDSFVVVSLNVLKSVK